MGLRSAGYWVQFPHLTSHVHQLSICKCSQSTKKSKAELKRFVKGRSVAYCQLDAVPPSHTHVDQLSVVASQTESMHFCI